MIIRLLPLVVFALSVSLLPSDALACACCADSGAYSIAVRKPSALELDELKKINFGAANLYSTPAYPDDVKGIAPLGEDYALDASLGAGVWKFDFKDAAGKSGTLSLTKPLSMVAFMADIHDSPAGGNGPNLYKEWRFKSRVRGGTGIFQAGIAPAAEYFLVLQGRGNACTRAEDFTHWRLEITGRRASYAFFGELKRAPQN